MKRLILFFIMIGISHGAFCAMTFSPVLANGATCQTLGSFGSTLNNGFTVSFWIKTSSSGVATLAIAGFLNIGNTTSLNINTNRGAAQAFQAGATSLNIRDESNLAYGPYIQNNNVYDGNWHNLVFVVTKPSTNSSSIYLDGISQTVFSGASASPATFVNLAFAWDLGVQNARGAINGGLTGSLNDFRIYNRALSAAEAQTIGKSMEYVKITNGLIAEWILDDGLVNNNAIGVIQDASSNKYTCTPFQNPVWASSNLNYP